MVTAHRDPQWVVRATQAGASALFPEDGSLAEMIDVLTRIRSQLEAVVEAQELGPLSAAARATSCGRLARVSAPGAAAFPSGAPPRQAPNRRPSRSEQGWDQADEPTGWITVQVEAGGHVLHLTGEVDAPCCSGSPVSTRWTGCGSSPSSWTGWPPSAPPG
ncbi:hypothetical protein ACI789_17415 [Geodermatophilus sp. SYSU D00965]